MRWIIALLLVVSAVYALPPQPALPSDSLPDYALVLDNPGTLVNATSSFTYRHDAPTSLTCSLNINSTMPINASVSRTRTERVSLANGSHSVTVTCSNSSILLRSQTFTFTVNNQTIPPAITLLYPTNPSLPNLNVTFKHHFNSSASCQIFVDDEAVTDPTTVKNNTWVIEKLFFDAKEHGVHAFTVTCIAGRTESAYREVNVTNKTAPLGKLKFTPDDPVIPAVVEISGQFKRFRPVTLRIVGPQGTERFNVSTQEGELEYEYNVTKAGTYHVNATQDNLTLTGSFIADERKPGLFIPGRGNITHGTAFSINGDEFYPNDNVTLSITGGTTITEYRKANNAGYFSYTAPKTLPAGTYKAVAKGKLGLQASLNFTISAAVAPTPPSNWTPPNRVPDSGSGNVDAPVNTDPGDDFEPYEPEPYVPEPNERDEPIVEAPSSLNLAWLWYVLVGILAVGGTAGYLVYNGTLDISNFTTFGTHKTAKINYAEEQTIKSFIGGERDKGFDDLTIRSALLSKGWEKSEVDRVFDEIYK